MNGRTVALDATARGCWVFRCHYRTKVPRVKDWPNAATNDRAAVLRWPIGEYNVGVACGPSGLVLVDIDGRTAAQHLEQVRAGRPLPPTFTVSTARSGGLHLWFAALPDLVVRNTAGKEGQGIAPGVDTRGVGGFGIAPGSVVDERAYTHPVRLQNGGRYVVVDARDPVPLPRWLAEAAQPRRRTTEDRPPSLVKAPTAYGGAALRDECGQLGAMRPPGRNHALNKAAYKLGQLVPDGILDQAVIAAWLMQAAGECHLVAEDGEARCLATIRSGLTAGMANPRQVVMAR